MLRDVGLYILVGLRYMFCYVSKRMQNLRKDEIEFSLNRIIENPVFKGGISLKYYGCGITLNLKAQN